MLFVSKTQDHFRKGRTDFPPLYSQNAESEIQIDITEDILLRE